MRRVFSFLILVGLLLLAYYAWQRGSLPFGNLKGISDIKAPDLKNVGGTIKDLTLTGSVKTALGLNRDLRGFRIDVETKDAVVRLKGALPSSDLRAMAETVAAAVPNVQKVDNNIRIDPSFKGEPDGDRTFGERLDDETIEVQVKLALTLRKELEGSSIHVSVLKKVATLSGDATPAQRQLAMKVAQDAPGVSHVTDEFGSPVRGSGEGREAVERAIASNANLAHDDIRVVQKGDQLSLVGHVRTGAEKDLASLIAERAAGVPVQNSLELKP